MIENRRKRNLSSTSVQLSDKQFDILYEISRTRQDKPSNAKILREAFDYFVSAKYPQFK